MADVRRWSFNILCVFCLLLLVTTLVLWPRSHWRQDTADWHREFHGRDFDSVKLIAGGSTLGQVWLEAGAFTYVPAAPFPFASPPPPRSQWQWINFDDPKPHPLDHSRFQLAGFGWQARWRHETHDLMGRAIASDCTIILPYWFITIVTAILPWWWLKRRKTSRLSDPKSTVSLGVLE